MRLSAGSAIATSAWRPRADAPTCTRRGPARNEPSAPRATKPDASSVRSRRSAVLAGRPARRAHSDSMIGSSSQTTARRPSARSTVRVEEVAAADAVDEAAAAILDPSYRETMYYSFHLAQLDCHRMAALHRGVTVCQRDFLRIGIACESLIWGPLPP